MSANQTPIVSPAPHELITQITKATYLVEELVAQCCTVNGALDSACLSTFSDAILWLESIGKVTITHRTGRRIIARWNDAEVPKSSGPSA